MVYVESDFEVESYNAKGLMVQPYAATVLELRNCIAAHASKCGKRILSADEREDIAHFCSLCAAATKEQSVSGRVAGKFASIYVMPSGRYEIVVY